MANIIDTLHPKTSPSDNLYPNIVKGNIPKGSIDFNKLDSAVTSAITSATPQIFDTEANILALTSNGGVAVATDTGYIYTWDSDNSIYSNTGILYQATGVADNSIEWKKLTSDVRNAVFNDATYLLPFVQSALIGDATWYQDSGEVEWSEKSNRLTISGIMYIEHSAVLYNSSASYGFNIFYYTSDSDSDYSSRTGYSYTTGYNIIPAGSYFRLVFRASDDSDITIADIISVFSLYLSNEDYNTWIKSYDTNYLVEQSKIKCAFSGNTENLSSDLIIDNHIGFSTTSYYNVGAQNRAMTRYIYYAFTDLTISIDDYDTYKNNVIYYNSSGTYLSRTTNLAYRVIIPAGSYFRIMFSRVDEAEMDSTDMSTLESTIHLENFAFTKIMDITASTDNPNATQQSCSTDGDNIYITYPSDTGTYIGAVQQYNKGGILLKEISNLTTVHASQTAYYNGDLYILGDKSKATIASIFKVDLVSGELSTITLTMQSEMVWDGFTIYGGYAYLVGLDYTASVSSQQPTTIVFEIVDLNTLTSIKVINATLPSHTHFGTQGLAINGSTAYAITSEAYNNQEWKPGLCIDKYDLLDGSVESSVFSSNFFYEPEGCFILDGYVCTTLANHGGVYRIVKLEK